MKMDHCQELYRGLLRDLDGDLTVGGAIHYIRSLQRTVKCDHIINHHPLRSHLYSRLSQHEPKTFERIIVGDYELEDQSHAIDVLEKDRFIHQRQLVQGLPMCEQLWYWSGHQVLRFLQGRSTNSRRHYPR